MIAVACACSYRAHVPDQFAGRSVICPRCGQALPIGSGPVAVSGGGAVAVAAPIEPPVEAAPRPAGPKCGSCSGPLAPGDRQCMRCGWSNAEGARKCRHCQMPVVQHEGISFKGPSGVIGIVVTIVMIRILGLLLWIGILFGIGAIVCVVNACIGCYKCGGCGLAVENNLLSKPELDELTSARMKAGIAGGVLGVLSLGCILGWVALVIHFVNNS